MLCYKCLIGFFIIFCSGNNINTNVVLSTTIENSATNTNNLDDGNSKKSLSNAVFLRQYPPFQQFGGGPMIGGGIGGGGIGGGGIGGIGGGGIGGSSFGGGGGGGCPLCDSSVYSYCSHKALHDMCCCDFQGGYYRPQQCHYADCSLLYAKTCYESSLIRNCCCNNPY